MCSMSEFTHHQNPSRVFLTFIYVLGSKTLLFLCGMVINPIVRAYIHSKDSLIKVG